MSPEYDGWRDDDALIPVQPFLVLCAVRYVLAQGIPSDVAQEVVRLSTELDADEANLISRDILWELSLHPSPDSDEAWRDAAERLLCDEHEHRMESIAVKPFLVLFAVLYALGRNTYMPSAVSAELIRIRSLLAQEHRHAIVSKLEEHLRWSVLPPDIASTWRVAVDSLS